MEESFDREVLSTQLQFVYEEVKKSSKNILQMVKVNLKISGCDEKKTKELLKRVKLLFDLDRTKRLVKLYSDTPLSVEFKGPGE